MRMKKNVCNACLRYLKPFGYVNMDIGDHGRRHLESHVDNDIVSPKFICSTNILYQRLSDEFSVF